MSDKGAIQEIVLFQPSIPLDQNYATAFGDLMALESLVLRIRSESGREGWGEVTILTGYTHETLESAWDFSKRAAAHLLGSSFSEARRFLSVQRASAPHATSPFFMAIELIEQHPVLRMNDSRRVIPLTAPLREETQEGLTDEIDRLLAEGYGTLKLKVGRGLDDDLSRLKFCQSKIAGQAKLRLDANQGYTVPQALTLLACVDTQVVEWLEQPCSRFDWSANRAVASQSPVPVMLDESIYDFDDINRAADSPGIDFAKIEMQKVGGSANSATMLMAIELAGLKAVCGNGAASDLSNWFEARAYVAANLSTAGEMHGYRKLAVPLLTEPPGFVRGSLVLPENYAPKVDETAVKRLSTCSERFSRT